MLPEMSFLNFTLSPMSFVHFIPVSLSLPVFVSLSSISLCAIFHKPTPISPPYSFLHRIARHYGGAKTVCTSFSLFAFAGSHFSL